jgi:general secretion pathway protein J
MPKNSKSFAASGFTLVELMIAIFIFGIVITSIFASYRAVFMSAGRVTSGIDLYDMAGICMNRISLDLQATHPTLPPKYRKPEFDDAPDPYRVVGETSDAATGEFPASDLPPWPISRLTEQIMAVLPGSSIMFGGILRANTS